MRYFVVFVVASLVSMGSIASAEAASAHKASTHHASAKGKTCKKEFMYWKNGKCMDARNAST